MKTRRDRRLTFAAVGLPIAAVEGVIGLLSLFTGIFRVPEDGSWASAGLVVNTALLASAIVVDVIAHKRGYRPRPPSLGVGTQPSSRGGGSSR